MQNLAEDASIITAFSNIADDSLYFENCYFLENYGRQNSIHILLSSMTVNDSMFENNYAKFVTHGITLTSSNIHISNTSILFESNCHWAFVLEDDDFIRVCDDSDFYSRLDLSNLDTGFFNLYLTSSATLTNNTKVTNLIA